MKDPRAGPGRARRILVVEDHGLVAETLTLYLSERGHQARAAGAGPEALELASELRPEAAVIDIGLPGMSGFELARRLREAAPETPMKLVALTGSTDQETARTALESGFDDYLTKPVDLEHLAALIEADDEMDD